MEAPTLESAVNVHDDGLNLLRVDERYDSAGGTIGDTDNWRMKELATHKRGSLGNVLGKKVYNYSSTNYTDTPSSSAFYAYHYDAVGNVLWVTDSCSPSLDYIPSYGYPPVKNRHFKGE